jgi:type II secretory pathway component GspD/PulD (secretin)
MCSRITLTVGLCLLAVGSTRAGEDVKSAPRMIEMELLIAETSRVAASENGELNLSAPADKLRGSLLQLEQQGKLDSLARVRLTSLENSTATIQVGQTTAFVVGLSRMPNSTTASVSERQTGLLVGITACCRDDQQIAAELNFEHSRLVPKQAVAADAKDANVVLPPEIATSTVKTTVLIPDGQTVLVGGTGAETSGQKTLLVILASARVRDASR